MQEKAREDGDEGQCKWCNSPVKHNQEWCVWCTALRFAARFCTIKCVEMVLAEKRAGLL